MAPNVCTINAITSDDNIVQQCRFKDKITCEATLSCKYNSIIPYFEIPLTTVNECTHLSTWNENEIKV